MGIHSRHPHFSSAFSGLICYLRLMGDEIREEKERSYHDKFIQQHMK